MGRDDEWNDLRDTFLRSAYVVYYIKAREISIANTKFNVVELNVMEIVNACKMHIPRLR